MKNMEPTTLKEALLTLRSLDLEAYKALLIASTDLTLIINARFLNGVRLKSALDSEEGLAMTKALEKARELVPWFKTCTNRPAVALEVHKLQKRFH